MKSQPKITFLSFNTFGSPFHSSAILKSFLRTKVRLRYKKIAEIINDSDTDIVMFQEVHLYHHFVLLRKALKNFVYVHYKKHYYGPRGGLVTFSKIPLDSGIYIKFSKTGKYWDKSIVGRIGKRGMLINRLRDYPLWIANTHLTQNSLLDWTSENTYTKRLLEQLQEVTNAVTELATKGETVVLGGDFNMPRSSQFYKVFTKQAGLTDIFSSHYFPTYIEEFVRKQNRVGRIDYIFVANAEKINITKKNHLFRKKEMLASGIYSYLSDHIGLQTTIKMV